MRAALVERVHDRRGDVETAHLEASTHRLPGERQSDITKADHGKVERHGAQVLSICGRAREEESSTGPGHGGV
ncbi:hypothetical protein GCM10027054_14210 [Isoptericola nanjingensis]